jgi:uncharacterized protein
VAAAERVTSVDVLRGVAVLGILAANIIVFGLPMNENYSPRLSADPGDLNQVVWVLTHVIIDGKMMTIFSMLFGAGLVLMGSRADERGRPLARLYYRRIFWLLAIGLVHSYFIWVGDILVPYAECGLLLYPLRRKSARALIVLGILLILVFVLLGTGVGAGIDYIRTTAERVEAAKAAGESPAEGDAQIHEFWTQLRPHIEVTREERASSAAAEIAGYRAPYLEIVARRGEVLLGIQTIGFPLGMLWIVGGRMLLGMGLMKLGVFSATLSVSSYRRLVAFGYGLGLPLVAYDTVQLLRHDFHFMDLFRSIVLLNTFGSILIALGHVGVVMLIVKAGRAPGITRRLAAVGQMALTNYLIQSLACTFLFYGYGFGLFGMLDRLQLAGVVLIIWTAQILYSAPWLRYFRFGPAEWLWRSLTYWKLQPLRRAAVSEAA